MNLNSIDKKSVQKIFDLMNETAFIAKILDADEDTTLNQSDREGLSIMFKRISDTLCDVGSSIIENSPR